jgi:hypothetical protein
VSSCSLSKGGAKQVADALMSTVRDVVRKRGRDIDCEKGWVEEGDGDLEGVDNVQRAEREERSVCCAEGQEGRF